MFKAARDKTGILLGVSSKDEFNRAPPTKSFINKVDEYRYNFETKYSKSKIAIDYVEKHYKNNFGDISAYRYFPFTRKDALRSLRSYCKHGILFMKYQDAIVKGKSFLGHSVLSAAINIGILDPVEVCLAIAKSGASESDIEGFVRQILGWREMMAIIYAQRSKKLESCFETFPIMSQKWYSGTTTLTPFDDVVNKAYKTAYLHHIERLMVALNAMVLYGVSPGSAYRWFMEVVSMDAYDWVMIGNLSSMGYSKETGTNFARKPYVSSSAYISRMSIGFEGGEWRDKWDSLFYAYVHRENPPYFKKVLVGKKYMDNKEKFERTSREFHTNLKS